MKVFLKSVYAEPEQSDGARILVDRLWPRGMSRERLRIDAWLKDLAPSDGLRRWFGHDPEKWQEFRQRYFIELSARKQPSRSFWAGSARAGSPCSLPPKISNTTTPWRCATI